LRLERKASAFIAGNVEGDVAYMQGRINHWANQGLALFGASRLNIKTLYWFFMQRVDAAL